MSDLVHDMYEYFAYDPEATRKIHRFYVKFFRDCRRVLDVACGRGEFLELLGEAGVEATGVDSDAQLCEERKKHGLNMVCADAFDYLDKAREGSFDGIFISHFVEHLSYDKIASLFKLCYKVLEDGGGIVVVVPNVSSIGLHLDWFYRDLSHVGFRHPKIIEFLMSRAGLSIVESGENPTTLGPLLDDVRAHLLKKQDALAEGIKKIGKPESLSLDFIRLYKPREGVGLLKQFILKIRWLIARYLFFPYLDELGERINQAVSNTEKHLERHLEEVNDALRAVSHSLDETDRNMVTMIERLDRSFEAYVYAEKREK